MRIMPLASYSYSIKNNRAQNTVSFKSESNVKEEKNDSIFFIDYYGKNNETKETIKLDTEDFFVGRTFNSSNIPILLDLLSSKENGDERFKEGSYYETVHNDILKYVENDHQASVARYILDNDELMNNKNIQVYGRMIINAPQTKEQEELAKHILDNEDLVNNTEFMNSVSKIIRLTKNRTQLNVKIKAIDKYAQDGKFSERKMVLGKMF